MAITNTKLEDTILKAVDIVASQKIAKAGYDKTIQATVVSCIDETIGKYKVRYQDSYWIAYNNNVDNYYAPNTNVYVLIPGGDMSKDKTILGTTKRLGVNYVSVAQGDERYAIVGSNIFDGFDGDQNLCSYKTSTRNLYNIQQSGFYDIDDNAATEYIKNSSSVMLSAYIRNDLNIQQRFQGNYGITLGLDFIDPASQEIITKYYTLDIDNMSGNPYYFPNKVRQYQIFEIDSANFVRVNSLDIFVKDFPIQKDDMPNDIFISKIELNGVMQLGTEDLSSCALVLLTPKGYIFTEESADTDIRTIQGQVRVKGKIIDIASQKVDFYWFVENLSVTSASPKYNKFGGQGWECLNNYQTIREATVQDGVPIPAVLQFNPGSNIFTVKKSDVLAQTTRYKCVAIYDNTVLSKEAKIIRYDSDYKIQITSSSGTQFYNNIGSTTLTCLCKRKNQDGSFSVVDINDLKFIWGSINNAGNFNSVTPSGEHENQIENIQINRITKFITFKCSVFTKVGNQFLGSGSVTISNSSKEEQYTLIINNGSQVFKYNTHGVSPASKQNRIPQEIQALTFTVYNSLGEEIDKDTINPSDITWVFPNNNTLLRNDYDGGIVSSDLENISFKNLTTFVYSIAENYNVRHTRNNIELKIQYSGLTLSARTNLNFLKQGQNGTNGTDFVCKIIPNVLSGQVPLNPTIYYYNDPEDVSGGEQTYFNWQNDTVNNKWFKAQLWHNGGQPIFESTDSQDSSQGKRVQIIKWEVLKNTYAFNVSDDTNLRVIQGESNGSWSFDFVPEAFSSVSTDYSNWIPANIIKVTLSYDGMTYYATLPIIISRIFNYNYRTSLKDYSGFREVVYNSSGQSPQFDSHAPFEITTFYEVGGTKEDISTTTDSNHRLKYDWYYLGSVKYKMAAGNGFDSNWVSEIETNQGNDTSQNGNSSGKWLLKSNVIKTTQINQKAIKPADRYSGECVTTALACKISLYNTNEVIAWIHIPIHMMRNRFQNSAINGWDGNSVNLGGDNGGMILAPQVGAGIKNSDNTFTGVFIGTAKDPNENQSSSVNNTSNPSQGYFANNGEDVGLFGYNSGSRTIFLDAKTGKAVFGEKGQAQIILDPTQINEEGKKVAQIKSGNYTEKTGSSEGSGLLIDLTTPKIKFGTENFSVDKNGYLTAKGGGELAGWKINNNAIFNKDQTPNIDGRLVLINENTTGMNSNPIASANSTSINGVGNGSQTKKIKVPTTSSLTPSTEPEDPWWQQDYGTEADDDDNIWGDSESPEWQEIDDVFAAGQEDETPTYQQVNKALAFWAGNGKFLVSHDGYLKAEQATIGSGTNAIFIGKNSNAASTSAIFSGLKTSKTSPYDGFYLGTNGLAIGSATEYVVEEKEDGSKTYETASNFQVDKDGTLYARKGYIGNGRRGWTIGATSLRNGKSKRDDTSNPEGVFIGTSGISLGRGPLGSDGKYAYGFRVTKSGNLTATKGTIAGWKINQNSISKDTNKSIDEAIGSSYLGQNGKVRTDGMYFGTGGLRLGPNFHVNSSGDLYANNGEFTGIIYATGGTISGDVTIEGTVSANNLSGKIQGYDVSWVYQKIITDFSASSHSLSNVVSNLYSDANGILHWTNINFGYIENCTWSYRYIYLLLGGLAAQSSNSNNSAENASGSLDDFTSDDPQPAGDDDLFWP